MAEPTATQYRRVHEAAIPKPDYENPYVPVDALGEATRTTAVLAAAGGVISGVQNSLARQNVGMMGIFTRTGGTIAVYAAVGAAYAFGSNASANLREKKDPYNAAIGGGLGGAVLGLRARSLPLMVGYGAALATVAAAFDFTGGALWGTKAGDDMDKVARKEMLRKQMRRPMNETFEELGEGRGIYAPGYEERRAARIKARYGIDVPIGPQSAS